MEPKNNKYLAVLAYLRDKGEPCTPAEIARDLNCDPARVREALKVLIEYDFVDWKKWNCIDKRKGAIHYVYAG